MLNRTRLLSTLAALAAFAAATRPARSATPPAVFVNHFFVVVDAESYAAMLADPYLTTMFAPFEKRTTVRSDTTYTGAYWYGRKTYFEVFEPPSQGLARASGLALGVEGGGESASVKASWEATLGAVETGAVTRRTEKAEPVWFHVTAAKASSRLRLWLMEYDKDFLARWYPDLTPERGITRSEVLDRYVAKIGKAKGRETAVLGNITGLVIALDDADRELLRRHTVSAGWGPRAGTSPDRFTLTGPEGVTIEVAPATGERRGIVEARFSVQGRPDPHEARLGAVRLSVEPAQARLRFVR